MNKNILILLTVISTSLFGQYQEENNGYLKNPVKSNAGIIAANNFGSSIYLIDKDKIEEIAKSPGVGMYYTLAGSKNKLGVKIITDDGLQIPAIINLEDRSEYRLSKPVKQCGQISFADDGTAAFTIGTKLITINGEVETEHELNIYSNIAPISPNGKFAAYNDLSDQIWLLELENNSRAKISNDKRGYFNPKWNRDGGLLMFSSLSDEIYVYSLQDQTLTFIDEGSEPEWSNDGSSIIYYKKEIEGQRLINSDLFIASSNGKSIYRLTDTKNIFEMDPSFGKTDNEIIYHTYGAREIVQSKITETKKVIEPKVIYRGDKLEIKPIAIRISSSTESLLNIPYVNQVYDTPDWHNGHWSCAPTAAIMVIAYFNALPRWETWCSYPSPGHKSYYGRYVVERYRYYQNDYRSTAGDAGGYPTQGGYGFMWSSGSPHTKMRSYYDKHRIGAVQDENPTYSEMLNEINAGYPYTMCVMLTSAGHLIIANGLFMDHTISFNDPYGNKNTPGYPSYDGKNVRYDWPGYNNGYQNLTGVAWCITNHRTVAEQADTLVDDLQFEKGFYLHNSGLASMDMWLDYNGGYNDHFWYKKTTSNYPVDTCFAAWTPSLDKSGLYRVSAYVAFSNAEAALYKIYHNGMVDTVTINQSLFNDEWLIIGEYEFDAETNEYVQLGDASIIPNQEIVFDAVKFEYIDSAATSVDVVEPLISKEYQLYQNYPNPFNPSTNIKFYLPKKTDVKINLYDALGNLLTNIFTGEKSAGTHSFNFSSKNINNNELSSGVYFLQMNAGTVSKSIKMVLLK
jgi:Tol biopolymer transport system component